MFINLKSQGDNQMNFDNEEITTLVSPVKAEYIRKGSSTAAGKIIITPNECAGKSLEYAAYFGNDNGILEGFTEAAHFPAGVFEKDIADCTLLPDNVTKLYIFAKLGKAHSPNPLVLDIQSTSAPRPEPLWKFWIITDLHVTSEEEAAGNKDGTAQNNHNRQMFADISAIAKSDPIEHRLIVTVGDNADAGRADQWENLCNIQKEFLTAPIPVKYTLGNHELAPKDYALTVENFLHYTGAPSAYYCEYIDGIPFIHTASVSASTCLDIDEKEQAWMKEIMDKAKEEHKPAFVFLHTPLLDTVSGSLRTLANQGWGGHVIQNDQLRSLFAQYPNVILFTGHTHWKFDSLIPVTDGNGADASFVNCASVGYLWNDKDSWDKGSEGFCVEVFSDGIILRGREFERGKWISYAEFRLPFYV